MRLGWVALATAVLPGTDLRSSEDELVGVCAEVFEIRSVTAERSLLVRPTTVPTSGILDGDGVAYSFGEFGLQEGIRHVRSMLC